MDLSIVETLEDSDINLLYDDVIYNDVIETTAGAGIGCWCARKSRGGVGMCLPYGAASSYFIAGCSSYYNCYVMCRSFGGSVSMCGQFASTDVSPYWHWVNAC